MSGRERHVSMNMDLRDKFLVLAAGLLLAFMAVPALAASGVPGPGVAAEQLDRAWQRGTAPVVPEHFPACFDGHDACRLAGVAPAPTPADVLATSSAASAGAIVSLPAPKPDIAPHAAVSLCILFCKFRE
jgi:hypothetical protein